MKLKNVTKFVSAIGKGIDEYGPQIMAVGSAVCFITGVIFAAKESPAALEALEEKVAENPDMNIFEKGATVVSRMPKTVIATVSGLAMHIFAWKKILGKLATVTGIAAVVTQDNVNLVEAAKEVVGPDKAKEIVKVKDQISTWDEDPSDKFDIIYPYTWEGLGITVWMTPNEYTERYNENVDVLADNEELSVFDYFYNFKCSYPPTQDYGWGLDSSGCGANPSDIRRWAKDELHADLKQHMYKGKYPGYLVVLDNMPTEPVENR